MWPRHTGDFSMFRIYADKDGKPAAYSKDNVPLKVKKHLTISLDGYREGDFTFVMGFPGRNWRYMISDEVEERMQTTNFMRHHVRDVRQKALMKQMLQDDAVRIPSSKSSILVSREVLTPSLMPVSNIPFSAILKTLRSLSRNQACIKSDMTG